MSTQNHMNKAALENYRRALSSHLKAQMIIKNKKNTDVIAALKEKGIVLEKANFSRKLSKGEMSADLFLVIMEVIGAEPNLAFNILSSVKEA